MFFKDDILGGKNYFCHDAFYWQF